jgi:hypothetical protein
MRSFFYWLTQEANGFTWIVTIVFDLFWNWFDGLSIFTGLGILCYPFVMAGIFSLCFVAVAFIQHYGSGDEWTPAMKKAAIFGLFAAVPFSVVTLIAGALGLTVKQIRGDDYDAAFGRFSINYRELEKTIKRAASPNGRYNGSWREISMETAIHTLQQTGQISPGEARELHEIRNARNQAYHEETPENLLAWVNESARLLEKYREKFGYYSNER